MTPGADRSSSRRVRILRETQDEGPDEQCDELLGVHGSVAVIRWTSPVHVSVALTFVPVEMKRALTAVVPVIAAGAKLSPASAYSDPAVPIMSLAAIKLLKVASVPT